jgi:sulfur relay (sulfurtransferase) DsrF/TusC family protein
MTKYFLIESRSPYDAKEVGNNYQLASDLAKAGNEVTLFLVENGVLATRKSSVSNDLANLKQVKLLADDLSLRERAIEQSELQTGIETTGIGAIVDAMSEGQKMIWL